MSDPSSGRSAEGGRSLARLIGVVLVDPLSGALAQMQDLVSNQSDMEVLVTAETADGALDAMGQLPYQLGVVVVVTLGLGGEHDSFWLIRSIREVHPTLPILACGTGIDDSTISWALFTGADGFVSLEVQVDQFLDALRRVARRELILEGLPSGWMASENDRAEPVVVLPEPAQRSERYGLGGVPEHGTMILSDAPREVQPEPQEAELVGASGPGSTKNPGSRIGRLFTRRRRGQPSSPEDGDGTLDDRQDSG
jgi:DNA-binding NarL/FixJ family response regulator